MLLLAQRVTSGSADEHLDVFTKTVESNAALPPVLGCIRRVLHRSHLQQLRSLPLWKVAG
jgi:hypothetical protein